MEGTTCYGFSGPDRDGDGRFSQLFSVVGSEFRQGRIAVLRSAVAL
jgi:hypothetical protein